MSSGEAKMSAETGCSVSASSGYISGMNLELVPNTHRAGMAHDAIRRARCGFQNYCDADTDRGGTNLTLQHSNVPDGQTKYEKGGWQSHYFESFGVA
jgi:hypothetical protein